MPRLHLSRLAVLAPLTLLLALSLGGCYSGTWGSGNSVAFGGRADQVGDLRTNVVTHQIQPAPGRVVRITNLAGRIELRHGEGDTVVMEAHVHARGRDDAHTDDLLTKMQWIETTDRDGRRAWGLAWPVDRHPTLHYVTDGRAFTMTSKRAGRAIKISTEQRPGAPTLFADITVTYPAGTPIEVDTLAGGVTGGALRGTLEAQTAVGAIGIESFDGNLTLDTGSGDIVVQSAGGTSRLDTGSGNIFVRSLAGTASLDTGSGDISVGSAGARQVHADTGSGHIRLVGGAVDELRLDTGSGNIEIEDVEFVELHGDTGSGNITIRSSLADAEQIHADTGSGNVTIVTDAGASFDARASLSSGRMHVGFDDATVDRDGRRATRARRGDGRTRIHVDTGSGNCTIEPGS